MINLKASSSLSLSFSFSLSHSLSLSSFSFIIPFISSCIKLPAAFNPLSLSAFSLLSLSSHSLSHSLSFSFHHQPNFITWCRRFRFNSFPFEDGFSSLTLSFFSLFLFSFFLYFLLSPFFLMKIPILTWCTHSSKFFSCDYFLLHLFLPPLFFLSFFLCSLLSLFSLYSFYFFLSLLCLWNVSHSFSVQRRKFFFPLFTVK